MLFSFWIARSSRSRWLDTTAYVLYNAHKTFTQHQGLVRMRACNYFMATLRNDPKEAFTTSHKLMLRAGMIQQIASGLYTWLPLGLRVLQKIAHIVRQEQNKAGALEMLAPTLQPCNLWQNSGRYDDYGQEMLRIRDRHENELCYGPTAEEVFTHVFQTHIKSYRDLGKLLYNIQWKFRDEVRPRFGVMRGREFLMKDTYSFDLTAADARASYETMFACYVRTFRAMGLTVIPVQANTGPIGGDLSHEFHIVAKVGESTLFFDPALTQGNRCTLQDFQGLYAMADERHAPDQCPVPKDQLQQVQGIEVGHIFYFGTKYAVPLNACVTHPDGKVRPVEMGSYGIGVSRLVGAIIEAFHDDRGIMWPVPVAPFSIAITAVGKDEALTAQAAAFYHTLLDAQMDAFLYDLPHTTGITFADMDLMGFPFQVIFGKTWQDKQHVDIKIRATDQHIVLPLEEAVVWLRQATADNVLL